MNKILSLVGALLLSVAASAQVVPFSISNNCSKNGQDVDLTVPYQAVDLGLSVKWANMNVGATTPEGYGDYFAWGETQPKSDYSWSTYKWMSEKVFYYKEYGINKYTIADGVTNAGWYSNGYFVGDYKTMLESADDAARANWGGSWRMPTDAEWNELRTRCTWTWTNENGVNGFRVSASNGNSIFLPAAEWYSGSDFVYSGVKGGCYWSAKLGSRTEYGGCMSIEFDTEDDLIAINFISVTRSTGRSVRPVRP